MATTVVVALAEEKKLPIASGGDSRTYLIRDNAIEQVTEDHSLVAENVRKGLLSKEEAKTAGDKNVITRALESGLNGDRPIPCTDWLLMILSRRQDTRTCPEQSSRRDS